VQGIGRHDVRDASTLCGGKATEVLETLQPALMVNETPSVVVAEPASAGSETAAAAARRSSTANGPVRFDLSLMIMSTTSKFIVQCKMRATA